MRKARSGHPGTESEFVEMSEYFFLMIADLGRAGGRSIKNTKRPRRYELT